MLSRFVDRMEQVWFLREVGVPPIHFMMCFECFARISSKELWILDWISKSWRPLSSGRIRLDLLRSSFNHFRLFWKNSSKPKGYHPTVVSRNVNKYVCMCCSTFTCAWAILIKQFFHTSLKGSRSVRILRFCRPTVSQTGST